ncbi:hypothetical protein Dimus_024078, partial [Dionaea muscipula]
TTRSVNDSGDDSKPQRGSDVWACGDRRRLSWAVVVEGSGDSGRRAMLGGMEEAILPE